MMKIAFKLRFVNRVVSVLSMTALVMPMMVSAATLQEDRTNRQAERQTERAAAMEERQENREAKKEEIQDKRQELFCSNFADHAATIATKMEERKNAFEDRKTNRAGTVDENRDNRDGKLEDKRSLADERSK
jgi:ABC-type Fe3+/spermidine/putrescine transport system ATPase subunit